jgi:hypothetical protein
MLEGTESLPVVLEHEVGHHARGTPEPVSGAFLLNLSLTLIMWGWVQNDLQFFNFYKAFQSLILLKNYPVLTVNNFISLKIKNAVKWCFQFYSYREAHNPDVKSKNRLDRGHIN